MSKRVDQEKKPEGPKGDLPKAHKEVNYRLTSSVELQELKKAMAESTLLPDLAMPKAKISKTSIQLDDSLRKMIPLSTEEPFKVSHVGNNLDPK
jgi:hypothetical protein